MLNKKGFTLIEVLVVVLIIGILASVGLRSYERSVYRARTTEASMLIGAVRDAMVDYGTEFGHCPDTVGEWGIAVDPTALEFFNYSGVEIDGGLCEVLITPKSNKLKVRLLVMASEDGLPSRLHCIGSDCDVFSTFGCEATPDVEFTRSVCPNFI